MRRIVPILLLLFASVALGQQLVLINNGVLTLNLAPGISTFKVLINQQVNSVVFQNPQPGTNITVIFTQNNTGGYSVNLSTIGGTPCTVSTNANITTVCQFTYDTGNNSWLGSGSSTGGGSVGPGTNTYVSCFNSTTNVANCPDSITDSAGTVTIPAAVVIGGGGGAASVSYPSGATSGCQTAATGTNILCSDGTNNTLDVAANGGPLYPLGSTQGIYDASTIAAADWSVAVNTLASAHPNSTIVIPDSLAGAASVTINVGSGNTLNFTGKGNFTFCTMSMGTFSKIVADAGATLTESGTNCPGIEYIGGSPTLQSSDHPYLRNVRINCNNQTGSVGLTINPASGGAALYDLENVEITGCLAEAVNIGAMQFSHWRNVHLQQNYLNFYGSSGGSISSNVFDHLSMQSNSSGVNFILANTSSSQDNGGNIFINPQSQNAAVAGMAFIGTSGNLPPQAHIIGYQPELDGTAALTLTFTNSSAVIGATNTLTAGQWLEFTTTGALPTNFAVNTAYCVLSTGLSTSQFEVSATCGGSAITAGSAGSGTQLAYYAAVINGLTIPQSGSLYLSNANVILDDSNMAEASADPVINLANGSALSLLNPSGYSSQFGRYVLSDSTSTVSITGQMANNGEIFNVAGYPDTITGGRGAMAGAPISTLDSTVPQAFAGNPIIPVWSSSTGTIAAGSTTDSVYGLVASCQFATSTGSTSNNRCQLTSIIPNGYTSATSNYMFSLLIKSSVATNQMSVEAQFTGGNMGFVFGNNGRLNLAAGQWTRVVGWAYGVTSGAEADLYIFPGDTAGATVEVTRIEAMAWPTNSNNSWGAQGTQSLSQVLKLGAVNPNNGALTFSYALQGNGAAPQATSSVLYDQTNTNTPAAAGSSTEFFNGRAAGGGLNSGQTTADIAFQQGVSGGGFRHFIETQHNAAASSDSNTFLFYVNNSTTAAGSSGPGTGNVLGFQITPNKIVAPNALQANAGVYNTNLLFSHTAPTFVSGFNTNGTISANNGTAAFTVTVGTGTATSTGVIGLPTATTGWDCYATNRSRADFIAQSASSTTSATLTNYGTTFAATNFTNSDVLQVSCFAY